MITKGRKWQKPLIKVIETVERKVYEYIYECSLIIKRKSCLAIANEKRFSIEI